MNEYPLVLHSVIHDEVYALSVEWWNEATREMKKTRKI